MIKIDITDDILPILPIALIAVGLISLYGLMISTERISQRAMEAYIFGLFLGLVGVVWAMVGVVMMVKLTC